MPRTREAVYGKGHLHLVACNGYQRQPKLGQAKHRDVFLRLLEELRVKFRFEVVGFVVVPDHFRLLMREPEIDTTANAVEMLQARYRRRYNSSARSDEQVWESRFSDAHVVGSDAVVAHLMSMHQEPVKLGLADTPEDWIWSSARAYAGLPDGVVTVSPFAAPATPAHAVPPPTPSCRQTSSAARASSRTADDEL
ncbi:MAG TPA: transposase [Acidobacteriaceae bacterium]|jgi:putative transposase|nr:transposase [Acidobacteriaceae bacterium]